MASRQAQDDVWAENDNACTASSFPARGGKVEAVEGGVVANGVWSFASGVDWADWNNMQVFVPREGGGVAHHMALVPKSDYRVIDDWNSPGLVATGSRSIELDNVFIPEHRMLNTAEARKGTTIDVSENFGPIFRVPPMCGANKIFSGPVIGMARGALDAIERDLSARNNVAGIPMASLTMAQMRVAEAGALIEAAWALMQRDCDVAFDIGEIGRLTTVEDRAFWRRNNAYAGVMCVKAVDILHPLIGARGLTPDSDFMRAYRDIHAATMQINMAWDRHAISAAEIQLGLTPSDPRA
jgi:3-hydroxy-9,10-secoandrosta-1,3,5(10)-triene-9,17-dione monooxygenase